MSSVEAYERRGDFERLSVLLRAAAHPHRLLILKVLREVGLDRWLCITEVVARTELDRFSVSRHLALLRASGLVVMRRDGLKSLHSLSASDLILIEDWIIWLTD